MRSELRSFELRDVDVDSRLSTLRGLAVPYDTWSNVGYYFERIMMGAPDKSVREAARGLPLLLFHDGRQFPVGRSVEWRTDDPAGLVGVWHIDERDDAQEAARLARDNMLLGLSIGFMPIKSDRVFSDEDAWDARVSREIADMQVTRREIRLLEVSLTPTPAYAGAQVELVRTAEPRPDRQVGMSAASRRTLSMMRDLAVRADYHRR